MRSFGDAFSQLQSLYQNPIYESEVPDSRTQTIFRGNPNPTVPRRPSQPNQLPQIQQRRNQSQRPAKELPKPSPIIRSKVPNQTVKIPTPQKTIAKTVQNNSRPIQNNRRPVQNTAVVRPIEQPAIQQKDELIEPIEEEKIESLSMSTSFAFGMKDGELRISMVMGVKKDNLEFYNQIQPALLASKELYEDETFPPVPSTISRLAEHSSIAQQVVWVRVPEVYSHKDITVCGDEICPDDIVQGQLGNCFFLSGLSALAEQKQYIQRLFHSKGISPTGCYAIWFCDSGEWKNILIDDYIPCTMGMNGYIPRFSKSHTNDIWVLLLEKAYAKLYGSYYGTSTGYQGEALSALTGAPVKYFTPKSNGIGMLDQIWLFLLGCLENKFVLTISSRKESETLNNTEMGLVSTHAYAILDAKEVDLPGKPRQRIIKMRNPWGNREWNGAWSDTSPVWTEQLKTKLKYEPKPSDGVFWISLADLNKHFFQPCVCKVHSNFGYSFVKLGENKKQNVFVTKMKVKSTGFGYITVQQRRRKHFQSRPGYDYSYIRVIIAKMDDKGQITSIVHGKYKNYQSIVIKKNFTAGNYLVLTEVDWVQTFHREFVLAAYSEAQIEFQEEPLAKYNIPSLYEKLIRTYIFTAGDPKTEGATLKISGIERQAWKYPFPTKFGLGALLLVNKENTDLHYKVQVDSFINMEIYIPKVQSSLVSMVVPAGKEAMFVLKAKVSRVDAVKNSYGYKCRESFAFAKQGR